MTATLLPWITGVFALSLALNAYRLARGPSLPDRILALDSLCVNTIALLVLLGIGFDTQLFFEAALVVALLGFISTLALAKYIARGDIIE